VPPRSQTRGLRAFAGKWGEGPAVGEPGKGLTLANTGLKLGGHFLAARNRSVYEPKSSE